MWAVLILPNYNGIKSPYLCGIIRFVASTSIWLFVCLIQCDQIGQLLKVLGNKILAKVALIFCNNFGNCKKTLFMLNWCGYFMGNFWRQLGYFSLQHLVTWPHSSNYTYFYYRLILRKLFSFVSSSSRSLDSKFSSQAVWPDWAIFNTLGNKFAYLKS